MLTGSDASALVEDSGFQKCWRELAGKCPWATVFQLPEFVCTWYRIFASKYSPAIVTGLDAGGQIGGLLTLACSEDGKELFCAGTHHAEYQVWLTGPESGNAFITAALMHLRKAFPAVRTLRFLHLPVQTPLDWTRSDAVWSKQHDLLSLPRPLMHIGDGTQFAAALAKKRYRNRISKLRQMGALEFEQITGPDQLETMFDQIVTLCDFRHGAAHGTLPFRNNSFKRPLYLALSRVPGLVHVTVLKLNEQIVSAQFNFRDRDQLVLGTLMHSPWFGEYSPGTLHTYFLGSELASQMVSTVDLTPGASYKDKFATHYDEVHILTVFLHRDEYLRRRALSGFKEAGRRLCRLAGLRPAALLAWMARARQTIAHPVQALRRSPDEQVFQLYSFSISGGPRLPDPQAVVRDCLDHLLCFSDLNGIKKTREFLQPALERIEAGSRVYTRVVAGRLTFQAWLTQTPERTLPRPQGPFPVEPGSPVLYDVRYHVPSGEKDDKALLTGVLHDAALLTGSKLIYMLISPNDFRLQTMIQELGGAYHRAILLNSAAPDAAS